MRVGLMPRVWRYSASTGSSIEIVAAATMTAAAHIRTAGTRRTPKADGTGPSVCGAGTAIEAAAIAAMADRAVTARNGSFRPPISYSHPPSDGPITNAELAPDMTMPLARPRAAGSYRSAIRANPTTHVTA